MTIDFEAPDFANTVSFVIRWFDQGGTKVWEQTQSAFNAVQVSPGHYRLGPSGLTKPNPVPAGLLTMKVAGQNAAGIGPESAPTAPFSISAPAAPINVIVTNPGL